MKYKTLYFLDGKLRFLNQALLPKEVKYVECKTHYEVRDAINKLMIRGAPAIGVAGAYAIVLAMDNLVKPNGFDPKSWDEAIEEIRRVCDYICSVRPTGFNLQWACTQMFLHVKEVSGNYPYDMDTLKHQLLKKANQIAENDQKSCELIGKYGAEIIANGTNILTYCNAGSLATSGIGTALAPIYVAHADNKRVGVYCCETRPVMQGARLTMWELKESGLHPTLLCDNMVGKLMSDRKINMVLVGADRIAVNGDVANKIGTFTLAITAKYHNIPFHVAAPLSTFDFNCKTGNNITIEYRPYNEVTDDSGILVYNPAFDITPNELITSIITDRGIIKPGEIHGHPDT